MNDHQVFDPGDSERERMLHEIRRLQKRVAELEGGGDPVVTFANIGEDRLIASLAAAGNSPIPASKLLPIAKANFAARRHIAARMAEQAMRIQTLSRERDEARARIAALEGALREIGAICTGNLPSIYVISRIVDRAALSGAPTGEVAK